MRQVPQHRWNVPEALASAVFHGNDPEEIGLPLAAYREEFQDLSPVFEGLQRKSPSVAVLDPTDLFVNASGRCRVAKDRTALYCDSNHLTVAGSMVLRPLFEPIIRGIRKSTSRLDGGESIIGQN